MYFGIAQQKDKHEKLKEQCENLLPPSNKNTHRRTRNVKITASSYHRTIWTIPYPL